MRAWVGLVAFFSVLLAGCASPGSSEPLGESVASLEMGPVGGQYTFAPADLVASAGSRVTLTLRNLGEMPHSFVVPELGVNSGVLVPGDERVITFDLARGGSWETLCDVPGHAEAGMRGTLVAR